MKEESNELRERILALFSPGRGSLMQKHFEKELSDVPLSNILPILNALQKEGILEVFVNPDRTLSWRLRDQSTVKNLKNLSDLEERLVYDSIRKAGQDAIALKSISSETKLPQNRIPRILKALISKKLVKELPMAVGHKQKVYLLMELEPSDKLAANTLFAGESGVDAEFIAMLRAACLKYMQDKTAASSIILDPLDRRNASYVSVDEIHRFITNSKICTVSMTIQDVKAVLDALKYGGELESRVSSDVDILHPNVETATDAHVMYRLVSHSSCTTSLAYLPCTICLCRKDCRPDGPINPRTCKLFQAFLEF